MLTAIEAPLYDIDVLSDRVMLPSLDSIPAAAVHDRLSLLKHSNVAADAQIIFFRLLTLNFLPQLCDCRIVNL
jgi:hypothetical protein